MEEQAQVMGQVNSFLERRGLVGKYLAAQVGLGEAQFYAFKSGRRLLTKRQLKRLTDFILDYDRRLDTMEVQTNDAQ